jgi:hypothetical protein
LNHLRRTPGWEALAALGEEVQQRVAQPLASRATAEGSEATTIPLLRADLAACSGRLATAVEEMLRLVDGSRLVRVEASSFFSGGIESEEQLEQALNVPDGVEISFQDQKGEDFTLTPEQRKGFLAGLAMAKSLFIELPFVIDLQEIDTAQDPVEEPVSV